MDPEFEIHAEKIGKTSAYLPDCQRGKRALSSGNKLH
jgi:hypothetical protein